MLNVFENDAFNVVSLTTAMNLLPYKPGRIGQLGLFVDKPITTTVAVIEEKQGTLMLIPAAARGTMPNASSGKTRKVRSLPVTHMPLNGSVSADDVQNTRAFGTEDQLETVSSLVNERLSNMRESHELTHEYHRIGAIQGVVLDADGATELYNLFDLFGITETSIEFDLEDSSLNLKTKSMEVKRTMEDALGATSYTRIRAFCGNDFFDNLVSHTEVKTAYERWNSGSFLRETQEKGFDFCGIMWENYRGSVGSVNFIPSTQCRFVVEGVPNLFQQIWAPANFIETVNTLGKAVYAKQKVQDFDIGVELHTQSNGLFMCNRPATLIKGYMPETSSSASASA